MQPLTIHNHIVFRISVHKQVIEFLDNSNILCSSVSPSWYIISSDLISTLRSINKLGD